MADTAKRLIMVNGPMGVGKTAVCRRLVRLCAPAAFLDGDWCWMLEPFAVTPPDKVACALQYCAHAGKLWPLPGLPHGGVLLGDAGAGYCAAGAAQAARRDVCAKARHAHSQPRGADSPCRKDIGAGLRGADAVARALCYREAYAWAPYVVDTTRLSPGEAAQAVLAAL